MSDAIPESVGAGDVVWRLPWPTRLGNMLGRAFGGALTVAIFALYNRYWWILLVGMVGVWVDELLRRESSSVIRIGPDGIVAGQTRGRWVKAFQSPKVDLRWNQIAGVDVVERWWGRQVQLAAPPVVLFPPELRSWRVLPDRGFDDRVALIRRTWLDAGPMPSPPPPPPPAPAAGASS